MRISSVQHAIFKAKSAEGRLSGTPKVDSIIGCGVGTVRWRFPKRRQGFSLRVPLFRVWGTLLGVSLSAGSRFFPDTVLLDVALFFVPASTGILDPFAGAAYTK